MRQDIGLLSQKIADNLPHIDEGLASLIRPSTARSKQSNLTDKHREEGSRYQLQPFPGTLEQTHLLNIRQITK
jgi:hypothetical protein